MDGAEWSRGKRWPTFKNCLCALRDVRAHFAMNIKACDHCLCGCLFFSRPGQCERLNLVAFNKRTLCLGLFCLYDLVCVCHGK